MSRSTDEATSDLPRRLRGPLRVCQGNPRFFADESGEAVFLTGSHTWAVLHDRRARNTPPFDYARWLDFLEGHGHNFFRLWAWEHASGMQFTDEAIDYEPNRYPRTGPGTARDGKPKFDVMRFDDVFFRRLRTRVAAAAERGIYVAVMLFQGFSLDKRDPKQPGQGRNAFDTHPLHPDNNIHGIDGDIDRSGSGHGVHSLDLPEITTLQERFIAKVVDAVGDLDNVLWEISNESPVSSVDWQHYLIGFLRRLESNRPKQHPIGMSGVPVENAALEASGADWVAPACDLLDPPAPSEGQVVVVDTDHIDAFGHQPSWPWRALMRGCNFTAMDPYCDARVGSPSEPVPDWEDLRRQMGLARRWSQRIHLTAMTPRGELASSRFCLAAPGYEYLVFVPQGTGELRMRLGEAPGRLEATWLECRSGRERAVGGVQGGAEREFSTAGLGGDAVLHLVRRS